MATVILDDACVFPPIHASFLAGGFSPCWFSSLSLLYFLSSFISFTCYLLVLLSSLPCLSLILALLLLPLVRIYQFIRPRMSHHWIAPNHRLKARNQTANMSHSLTDHPTTLYIPWTFLFLQGTFLFCEERYILQLWLWGCCQDDNGLQEVVEDISFYYRLQEVVEDCKERWNTPEVVISRRRYAKKSLGQYTRPIYHFM